MLRAARRAAGAPSKANHAPFKLGGSPATKVIMGWALPVCTPRLASGASNWLLSAPLACRTMGGSVARVAVCATSSIAASGTAIHKRSQSKFCCGEGRRDSPHLAGQESGFRREAGVGRAMISATEKPCS